MNTKIKIISTNIEDDKTRSGEAIENLVNEFCKGKKIIDIKIEFLPHLSSSRYWAYITYKK